MHFYALLIEEALDAYDLATAARERAVALQLLHEEAEAMEAQAAAQACPSRAALARAVAETREAIAVEECYVVAHAYGLRAVTR